MESPQATTPGAATGVGAEEIGAVGAEELGATPDVQPAANRQNKAGKETKEARIRGKGYCSINWTESDRRTQVKLRTTKGGFNQLRNYSFSSCGDMRSRTGQIFCYNKLS